MDSSGSALKENEKYLDSIQGKLDQFTNSLQTFWNNLLKSETIKGFVDFGTKTIQFLDTIPGKITAIVVALAGYIKIHKKLTFSDMLKGAEKILKNIVSGTNAVTGATLAETISRKANNKELLQEILTKSGLLGVNGTLTKEQVAVAAATLSESFANGKLTASQYLATMSTMGLKTALQGLWTIIKANPIVGIVSVITVVLTAAALAFNHFHKTAQEAAETAKEAFDEIQGVVDSTKSAIQELESELTTLQDKIEALNGKQLSFAEGKELEKLKEQREELEHSLKIQEQLLELQREASNKQAVTSMKAYTKAASEGAEETQETAKTWGAIGGVVTGIATVLGVLLAVPTGGTSLAATLGLSSTAIAGSAAAGGAAVGIIGGVAGKTIGSSISENEGTYDSWYETYTKALETSREEEQKALKKYQKDSSNIDKLDKWQEAQQKTSDIETEMYEHLSQMQQYYNGLEYGMSDEIDKELNTWYNFLDKFSIQQGASGAEVTALDRIFGENASEEIQSLKKQIVDAINTGKDFDFTSAINGSQELSDTLNYVGLKAEDVKNYFTQIGESAENNSKSISPVKTYSDILESIESFNEIQKQSEEIVIDNTKITQEYKEALIKLIGSEDKVNEYFDKNNKLVVKDAKGLNNLVKATKRNVSSNAALAKSQARLKYYELFKEMSGYINAEGKIVKGSTQQILSLYNEMNALEKTIARYSMLEVQLLGTVNAYEKFKQAQEADSETDYIGNAEEMVKALGEAFNTAELGSETAQAAIAGLVPESVYEDLDTVDEKMAAIYSYFKKGKIAQYFSLEFDDDGSITSAEMKLGNLRKFIEDGLTNGVFTGSDWQHFDLSSEFGDLEEGADKLQYLADKMSVTKDVAFAFFKSLEDHDIEWLNGDYSSILEDLLPESFERDIYNAMQDIASLNAKLADGSISAKEYAKQFSSLSLELEAAKKASRENMFGSDGVADKNTQQLNEMDLSAVDGYFEANQKVANAQTAVTEATKKQIEAEKALSAARNDTNVSSSELKKLEMGYSAATEEVLKCDTALQTAIEKRDQFAQPTEMEIQVVLDDIEQEIANAGGKFEKAVAENFDIDENGYYTIKTDVDLTQLEVKYPGIKQYVDLLNSKTQLDAYVNTGEAEASLQDVVDSINKIVDSLNSIQLSLDKKSAEQLATDVRETIANLPKNASIFVKTLFNGKGDKEKAIVNETGDVNTDTSAATSSATESNESMWAKIDTFFNETIPEKWTQFWDSLGEKFNEVKEQAEILKTKVVEFFTITIPEKWDGFWDAVGEKIGEIKEQANILQEKVNDFFTNTLPEKWDEFWENAEDFLTEDVPYAIGYAAGAVKNFFTDTVPEKWDEFWDAVKEKFNEIKANAEVLKQRVVDFFTVTIPEKWDEFWTSVGTKIDELKANAEILKEKVVDFFTVTIPVKWGEFWDGVGTKIDELKSQAEVLKTKVINFFTVTIPTKWTEFWNGVGNFITETVPQGIEMVKTGITTFFTVTLPEKINSLWDGISSWIVESAKTFWSNIKAGFKAADHGEGYGSGKSGGSGANGTVHIHGTAHATGNFGLPSNEHNALVGELGPEMIIDPATSRYYTVGDNGAEMVDLPKGAIIFNHKQTADLLNNGYVTSRGKMLGNGAAHAGGNAHVTIFPNGSSKNQWTGTGYSSWDDPTYDASEALNNAADSLSNAADDLKDDFEEVFDWVEVRLDEIDETLDLLDAKLENAVGYSAKNDIIDQMLGVSNTKMANLQAGLQEYSNYAAKLLSQVPAQYQAAVQDGAIAIEEFAGEADEKTLEAIKNYREWAEKVADLTQKMEELNSEISKLAKQKFDNIVDQYDDIIGIIENQNEKLEAQIDLMEDRGYVASKKYYEQMMSNTQRQNEELIKEKNALQDVLDKEVKAGNIKVGDPKWYEMVDQLYEVDAAIVECTADMESFQNAINDIYWDNFDELINRIDYLNDETQNLIDLMENSGDLVSTPDVKRKYEGGTKEYWTADDVKWTDEGIASLGLYAQKMEIAEYQARQYQEAINDLDKDYADGKYSETEYLEKLNELKDAQYDAIDSYYDAQKAIVDLNKTRIDAIKNGIEKEIDAYDELIKKKKEELQSEKDVYDFQKSTAEQQKNIADIERKLAALSVDNSASAAAQRKKLQAELAQAKSDLDESYYDRSISDRQDALDKELEDFEEEKNAEIEKLEEYLENVQQVVADSLMTVQANASTVYDTLNEKADEYNLNLSDSILTPWRDGAIAVDEYQEKFGTSMSSTMDQLEVMKNKWQEVIDKMQEAAGIEIKAQEEQNNRYVAAKNPAPAQKPSTPQKPTQPQKTIKVGGKINASGATIYADSNGGGASRQYYAKDPIYVVLDERNGFLKVRHHSLKSGVTGWFKKSAVKAYAKGTKGIDKDQLAIIDELGEELQLVPDGKGRLSYMKKGTGILNNVLTERLMNLAMNPQSMLDQNRPQIKLPSVINNTEIHIDNSISELIHIDNCSTENLPDMKKIINDALEKHDQKLNNSLRKYVR